jgi:transposase
LGYGIQRQLTLAGHGCVVVAPSLIPRKPGDRIRTHRRDAIDLAKLHRAGELTAVWIPDQAHEAIRDLAGACLAAVRSLRQARQQLRASSVVSHRAATRRHEIGKSVVIKWLERVEWDGSPQRAQNAPGKGERARRQTPPGAPASARIAPAGF